MTREVHDQETPAGVSWFILAGAVRELA